MVEGRAGPLARRQPVRRCRIEAGQIGLYVVVADLSRCNRAEPTTPRTTGNIIDSWPQAMTEISMPEVLEDAERESQSGNSRQIEPPWVSLTWNIQTPVSCMKTTSSLNYANVESK
jgi:hypothetical protein